MFGLTLPARWTERHPAKRRESMTQPVPTVSNTVYTRLEYVAACDEEDVMRQALAKLASVAEVIASGGSVGSGSECSEMRERRCQCECGCFNLSPSLTSSCHSRSARIAHSLHSPSPTVALVRHSCRTMPLSSRSISLRCARLSTVHHTRPSMVPLRVLQRALSSESSASSRAVPSRVGVVGGGQMGTGIAYVASVVSRLPVTVVDSRQSQLDSSAAMIGALLEKDERKGKLTAEERRDAQQRFTFTADIQQVRLSAPTLSQHSTGRTGWRTVGRADRCVMRSLTRSNPLHAHLVCCVAHCPLAQLVSAGTPFIIEAVTERVEVKKAIFQALNGHTQLAAHTEHYNTGAVTVSLSRGLQC